MADEKVGINRPNDAPAGVTTRATFSTGGNEDKRRVDQNAPEEVKRRQEEEAAKQKAYDEDRAQKVTVRALKSFHKEDNFQGEMTVPGEDFETTRGRAAQLRAGGLIEFHSADDAKAAHGSGTDPEAMAAARINQERTLSAIPANSKGTPLRNPKLTLDDVPENDKSKR